MPKEESSEEEVGFIRKAMAKGYFSIQLNQEILRLLVQQEVRAVGGIEENLEMKFYKGLATGIGITATLLFAGGLLLTLLTGVLFSAVIYGNVTALQSLVTYASSIAAGIILYYVTWICVKRYERMSKTA